MTEKPTHEDLLQELFNLKKIEEAFKESEKKYRELFEANQDAITIFRIDPRGVATEFLDFNEAALKLGGYSREEMKGMRPDNFEKGVSKEIIEKRIAEIESKGHAYFETVLLNKSGEKIPIEIDVRNILYEGRPAMMNIARDIRRRKFVESALIERQVRYRTLANSGTALIWTSGPDKLCNYFNEPWLRFTGRTLEQELGDGWTEGVHPDDLDRCMEIYVAAFDIQQEFSKEYRLRHVSGEYRWIQDEGTPFYDSKGEFLGYIGHCLDITTRKRAEEALRQSEIELQNLLQTIQAGIIVHDVLKNRIKNFNQMALTILGLTEEQLLGKSKVEYGWSFINEDGAELTVDKYPVNIVKKTRKPLLDYIIGITNPSEQEPTWVIVKANPQFDQNGELAEIIISSMDITELKNTQNQLRKKDLQLVQAQKLEAIGNLAGGIAHDFNNILSSIIGFTQLALEAAPKGSSQRDDLEEVYIASNRAKELVQQILAFARQSEKSTKPIRLSDIVTEALKLLRPSTPVTIDIQPTINSPAKVIGNPSQLHQIVMNLCTNAIHSLQKSGGVLEIGLRNTSIANDYKPKTSELPAGEYVELTITDDGPGIDPAIIENIFEPYFTTKGIGEGTGMGLAMVKGIIASYSGDINVKSEPGGKTSFAVRLPVATQKRFEELDPIDPVASGTERILFVDDEPPIARMGNRMLESLGYTVTIRTSSFEALELFKEKPDAFDLVVTDMTMPAMTGDVLSMEMRKIRPGIPIILCTGYSNKINEEGAKQIGIDAFAYKPFTKSDLAKTIREVLDTNRANLV